MMGSGDQSSTVLHFWKSVSQWWEMGPLGMPALSRMCLCEPSSKAPLRDPKVSFQKQVWNAQIIAKNGLYRDFQSPAVTWWSWQLFHPMTVKRWRPCVWPSGAQTWHRCVGIACRILLPSTAYIEEPREIILPRTVSLCKPFPEIPITT